MLYQKFVMEHPNIPWKDALRDVVALYNEVSSRPGGTLHIVGRFVVTFKYAHAVGDLARHC